MTWEMYEALVEACDRVDARRERARVRPARRRRQGVRRRHRHHPVHRLLDAGRRRRLRARLDAVIDRLERVREPTIAQVAGRGGRRRLRHRARLRPARLHAGATLRRARRPDARQLPVGRQLRRLVDLIGPARRQGPAVHRPPDRRPTRRARSGSSPASSTAPAIDAAVREPRGDASPPTRR